ncbi:MAG: hypothetical protein ISS15_02760 [Alphaproteobacteria bacterium]|nr:hypothetical protein [Alphaproteobacteria bacterium]MBL7096555.1 hypothetical protein [Alphaproteobacteria bacterium]
MRLICGLMRLDDAPASPSILNQMVAQLDVPRLCPGHSAFCDGPVAMAVLDFSATSLGALPTLGSIVMAADVRLDEPAELAQSLNVSAQAPDLLLLEVVKRFGVSGPERILGDFAFSAWDGDAEKLTCGRDIFGIRPFSYVHKPGQLFAFASLPSALHGGGIVPKRINTNALLRRTISSLRFDDSLIEGIARLPPGHTLQISRNGISLRRYWQPDRTRVGTARITPEDAAAELRRRVEQAVRSRLPKGARLGSHLSGGLDSSAIAVLAARALRADGRTLHTYSFLDRPRNDVQLVDETEYVRACVEQESDMDWQPVRPSSLEPGQSVAMDPDSMHSLDPENPENQVAAMAERQGVDLILSGWGGDEAATFNGRGALAELLKRGHWRALQREIVAMANERHWTKRRVLSQEVMSYLVHDLVPDSLVQLAYRAIGRKPDQWSLIKGALAPGMVRTLKDARSISMTGDGRENRWRLINHPHIALRAEAWAQTGARHGLAYAFPLLDRRVVEFALSLPSELFLSGGFRRRPFRDAMQDVLPEKVRARHQKYVPFPGRFVDLTDARDDLLARITTLEADENVRGILDLGQLRTLVTRFPSPNDVRQEMAGDGDPKEREMLIAADCALELATYLQQHGAERS